MSTIPKVIVFTSPTCSWCRAVKNHLHKLNVRFREVDISRDPAAARDMVRRTGQQGVPVTLVNNHPVVGFDQAKLNRLLGVRG
ncbi:MAG: glutaredoxin domain-containing protein [Acidobacteriota bacterium]|nr:glutaredoxin domain-containing protein [Acidobacteriota bacterium]